VTTQPDPVHHLLDRLLRGVLLPEEAEQLAGAVRILQARVNDQDGAASVAVSAVRLMNQAGAGRDRAEATVARVRQAVDAGPVGSCCAHLIHAALNPPTGLTVEERKAADAYAAKLNTPPSAATLAAIAERIADGTAPRRKVRRRAAIDSPSDTAQQHEAT